VKAAAAACRQLLHWFLVLFIFDHENGRKMFSETSIDVQRTTIPEDINP
jgi:hypothetical protein